MSPKRNLQITVIGTERANEAERRDAYRVGEKLGEAGAVLICGGGAGVMEQACRGMRETGQGTTVGILKGTRISQGNGFLDLTIPTGIGPARNLAVVLSGQAVIAVGGHMGTLTEIAYARKFKKPVFGVRTWAHPRFDFPTDLGPDRAVERAIEEATDSTGSPFRR